MISNENFASIQEATYVRNLKNCVVKNSIFRGSLLWEVVINFWLFFLFRHFQGRRNLPMLTASLLRRTVGGVFGIEWAPLTGLPTSVEVRNVGALLVGTVLIPFIITVGSLCPGSLFERSRERLKSPEGDVRPSVSTSIFWLHTDSSFGIA